MHRIVQDSGNSIVNARGLPQSCATPRTHARTQCKSIVVYNTRLSQCYFEIISWTWYGGDVKTRKFWNWNSILRKCIIRRLQRYYFSSKFHLLARLLNDTRWRSCPNHICAQLHPQTFPILGPIIYINDFLVFYCGHIIVRLVSKHNSWGQNANRVDNYWDVLCVTHLSRQGQMKAC